MNDPLNRKKISDKANARWSDPAWKEQWLKSRRRRPSACSTNHENILKWAAESVPKIEIARRIGTNGKTVDQYLKAHGVVVKYAHYVRENNPCWKGGRTIDKDGYVLVLHPEHPEANFHGYVREHRLVMEKHIGRPLLAGEVVHHVKPGRESRSDNRISNLMLFDSNGQHLAETMAGNVPNWSPGGLKRMQEAADRRRKAPRPLSIRSGQKTDDPASLE